MCIAICNFCACICKSVSALTCSCVRWILAAKSAIQSADFRTFNIASFLDYLFVCGLHSFGEIMLNFLCLDVFAMRCNNNNGKKRQTLALARNTQAMVKWHSNWFNVAFNEFDEWIYLLMFNHSKPSGSCNSFLFWLAISEWHGNKIGIWIYFIFWLKLSRQCFYGSHICVWTITFWIIANCIQMTVNWRPKDIFKGKNISDKWQ